MTKESLKVVGLVPPVDFPAIAYDAVIQRLGGLGQNYPDAWGVYVGGWNGLGRRFISCAYYDETFTESLQKFAGAPSYQERQLQEHALFGFFVTGLSTIESFCYALHAIGSMINPSVFPVRTPQSKRNICPKSVLKGFLSEPKLSGDQMTSTLRAVLDSSEYDQWKDIRNLLIHREAPPRLIRLSVGGSSGSDDLWVEDIPVNARTTRSRREWLSATMASLLCATDEFTARHF